MKSGGISTYLLINREFHEKQHRNFWRRLEDWVSSSELPNRTPLSVFHACCMTVAGGSQDAAERKDDKLRRSVSELGCLRVRHKRLGLTPLVASVYLDRSRLCFMFQEGITKRVGGRGDWLRRILRLTLPEDDVHPARIRKAAAFVLRSVARNVFRESGWTGATACSQGWSSQTPLRLRTVQPGHQNLTFALRLFSFSPYPGVLLSSLLLSFVQALFAKSFFSVASRQPFF